MEFYEDDEPVEEIEAAFERGEKGLTSPPDHRVVIGQPHVTARGNRVVDRAGVNVA